MAQPLSVILPLMLPHLPGCAEIVAEAAARQAAIEFCTKSRIIQRTLAPVLTEALVDGYGFALAPDESVAVLLSATLSGKPMDVTTPAVLDGIPSRPGLPRAIVHASTLRYMLWPTPVAAGAPVVARVAIRPTQAAATLPDELVEGYAQAIAYGAIAQCAGHPNRSYTNPQIVGDMTGLFADAITSAKVAAFNANARTAQRVPPAYF